VGRQAQKEDFPTTSSTKEEIQRSRVKRHQQKTPQTEQRLEAPVAEKSSSFEPYAQLLSDLVVELILFWILVLSLSRQALLKGTDSPIAMSSSHMDGELQIPAPMYDPRATSSSGRSSMTPRSTSSAGESVRPMASPIVAPVSMLSDSTPGEVNAVVGTLEDSQHNPANHQIPMVYPVPMAGTPGVPMFDGTSVTQFCQDYDLHCEFYRISNKDRLRRLPQHCSSEIRLLLRYMDEVKLGPWDKVKRFLKKEFRDQDDQQKLYTEEALAKLSVRSPKDASALRNFCRLFTSISKSLVNSGELSEYRQCKLFLQGLPERQAEKIIKKFHIDVRDATTVTNFQNLRGELMSICDTQDSVQALHVDEEDESHLEQVVKSYTQPILELGRAGHRNALQPETGPAKTQAAEKFSVTDKKVASPSAIDEMMMKFEELRLQSVETNLRMASMQSVMGNQQSSNSDLPPGLNNQWVPPHYRSRPQMSGPQTSSPLDPALDRNQTFRTQDIEPQNDRGPLTCIWCCGIGHTRARCTEFIEEVRKNLSYSVALRVLEQVGFPLDRNTYYNIRSRPVSAKHDEFAGLIVALEEAGFLFECCVEEELDPNTNAVIGRQLQQVWFAHPQQIQYAQRFISDWTLFIDGTFKTNALDLVLIVTAGITDNNSTFVSSLSFARSEAKFSFDFIFNSLRKHVFIPPIPLPRVVVSDQAAGMTASLPSSLSNTILQFCDWHAVKNVEKRLADKAVLSVKRDEPNAALIWLICQDPRARLIWLERLWSVCQTPVKRALACYGVQPEEVTWTARDMACGWLGMNLLVA
jgi:MULE transposase domain